MKKLFVILLVVNVTFFSLMYLKGVDKSGQVNHVQLLHEDKIRLLDASKSESIMDARLPAAGQIQQSPTSSSDLQLSMSMSVPTASERDTPTCLEWGDFSGADLVRATTTLAALQLGDRLSQREVEYDTGYWVYIPPLKNKSAVNKKIGELRDMGIREYFVVSNAGRWRNAISLGVFKTREAAQNLLNQLRAKGVRSAQIGERASKLKTTRFMLSEVNSETKIKLTEIQKDYSGSALEKVPCTLTR